MLDVSPGEDLEVIALECATTSFVTVSLYFMTESFQGEFT